MPSNSDKIATRPGPKSAVAHLTSVHPPFDTRIFVKECCSLAAAGRDVALVACHRCDEIVDGVQIYALTKHEGRLRRMLVTQFEVLRRARESEAEIVHIHDPELIPVAVLLKASGRRVIYDVHEDLPKQITAKEWIWRGVRYPVAQFARCAEWVADLLFDGIVAVTPQIADRFSAHKTILVQNYPLTHELYPATPTPYSQRPPVAAYIGGITRIRGAHELVDAMDQLRGGIAARLELAGPFSSLNLQNELKQRPGWEAVSYLGIIDRKGVCDTLSRARVGLVTFLPSANHMHANP